MKAGFRTPEENQDGLDLLVNFNTAKSNWIDWEGKDCLGTILVLLSPWTISEVTVVGCARCRSPSTLGQRDVQLSNRCQDVCHEARKTRCRPLGYPALRYHPWQ